MGMSQYLSRALLNHLLGNGAYTVPTNRYVALMTNVGGTEVSGNNYARVLCNSWSVATLADPSVSTNSAVITFPTPSGSWGTVTHFQLFDALTGTTNALSDVETLTASKTIASGDGVDFQTGQLAVTLT